MTAPPAAPRSEDPFASLPRIRPFTDFALEPADAPPQGKPDVPISGPATAGNGTHRGAPLGHDAYTGRRRRGNDAVDGDESGRHARNAEPAAEQSSGRRRRGDERDNGEDLLARLLARESADS